MALELIGTVDKVMEIQEGTSKSGNEWKKGGFVMTYGDQFPKKVYFDTWGNMIEEGQKLKQGQKIKVSIDLQSNESGTGRWFTNAKAWRIELMDGAKEAPEGNGGERESGETTPPPPPPPEASETSSEQDDSEDDLPF